MNTSFRFQENFETVGPNAYWLALSASADLSLAFSVQGVRTPFSVHKKPVLFKSTDKCTEWQQQQVTFIPGSCVAVEGTVALVSCLAQATGYAGPFANGLQRTTDGITWSLVLSGYVSSLSMCGQNAVALLMAL